ncbi:FtsX-like permease family protein [Niastella caeni]|uniref:FtsX-like permease family protein n=1 Tax=Niastella caeni TaxID=2569763 RepID=A0A4S8HIJ9_9BACT|nr:ABC transporter permease [Niastella caeni]THU34845.1 FtsX-like permease family protein [Niastella caeni]
MLRNYFKIAFRNLWRHRVFSFINIMGLTVGMTACFLIFLYVRFELSYDSFHPKADRIYRVVADIKTPTEVLKSNGPAWAVGPHVQLDFPEVEAFTRVHFDNLLFRKGDIKFNEEGVVWADSAFFNIFGFRLLKGDARTALMQPFTVVLSETAAKKYFGKADPMGQTILITSDGLPATVTGVMQDMPENTLIKSQVVLSMSTITLKWAQGLDDQWGDYGPYSFLLLKPGTNAIALQKKFPAFLEKWNGKEMNKIQMYPTLFLEQLKDVYLRSDRESSKGNLMNVYIFSIIAIFILVIACINFINLTTARASERAKEVGIRKVAGAIKAQLARQFIGESLVICLIAFLLTIGLTALLLPSFNELAGKIVSQGILENGQLLLPVFGAAIVIGLLAGIYPAFVLSSFKPIEVLKGRFATGSRGGLLRKTLVISQFAISTALIIGTIIVYSQMRYMRNQQLGFNKDQVMVVDTEREKNSGAFVQAISRLPNVKATSLSASVPGGGHAGAYSEIENIKGDLQIANLDLYFVDFDYIPLYNIQMAAGRPFSREYKTDSNQAIILNEAAVKILGYPSPEQAIGKRFKQWGREGKIIGVMKDFHYHSLQQPIKPLTMRMEWDRFGLVSVKVNPSNIKNTIAAIEKQFKTIIPNRPFSYYFLDEFFDRQYRAEERFGKLFLNFAILAIFISCLGLLGLASYSTIQRTREIGIRKVMGASVSNIINLLSKEFLKLVIISFFIAVPVAWYFMHKWLADFAYRTPISWWIFVTAGIMALLIAIITISFQAFRAAVANPVKSLRTE